MKYITAGFHKELFELTEESLHKMLVIEAFRGSGKTTIMGTSYSIWSILGIQKKKFVLLIAKTASQAKQYLANIKMELESNKLLRSDLGPFEEFDDEWRAASIVLPKYGARITVASTENSIRGIKHGAHRPDLIICDDLEDLDVVKTQESRDKMYNWLTGDIIPLGDKDTRLIVIGTKLHHDSIIMRLKNAIRDGKMLGIAKAYPFLDKDKRPLWSEKYQTENEVEILRKSVPSEQAWQREYMLNIISDDTQVISREWLKFYDTLPDEIERYVATGVDPAIGTNQENDCTAMVSAKVYGRRKRLKIYVLPQPFNDRVDSKDIQEKIKERSKTLGNGLPTFVWIESVGYQKSIIEYLVADGFPAKEFKPYGSDKRAKLSVVAPYIQSGTILFPRHGAETLIEQMIGFGTERHDDLVDALCILILSIIDKESHQFDGYHELFPIKLIEQCYAHEVVHTGEKRIGIYIGNPICPYSAIILRSESTAEVLYHERTDDVRLLAKKVLEIVRNHKMYLIQHSIFMDESGQGREIGKILKNYAEGHTGVYEVDLHKHHQNYGINWNEEVGVGDENQFADLMSFAYSKLKKWVVNGGILYPRPIFDDLPMVVYIEQNGKMKVIDKKKLAENDTDISIIEALVVTTVTEKRNIKPVVETYKPRYPKLGV